MIEAFGVALTLVGLAELGDKTQLAALTLSAQYRKPLEVFVGAMLAFLLVDGIAAILGGFILTFIPIFILKIASGIVFISFGTYITMTTVISKKEEKIIEVKKTVYPFISAFSLITISEFGDKTQITTILLSAEYNAPISVLLGVMLALGCISGAAIILGDKVSKKFPIKKVRIISGIVFIIVGIASFLV
jgi:putative Ca2+/H+ antiporter (TMEM165/GDT1 family)